MGRSISRADIGRRASQRASRRDAIFAIAKQYFLKHGYAGTSMSAIAAELGGSKGTLWSYFPSKEELFAAVIDEASANFRAQLSEILTPAEDVCTTLTRFCLRLLEKMAAPEPLALYRVVVSEAARFPELGRIFFDRAISRSQRLLADYIEGVMDRGYLRREDPLSAARCLIGLCTANWHQQWLLGVLPQPTPEMMRAEVERGINIFMAGMRHEASD